MNDFNEETNRFATSAVHAGKEAVEAEVRSCAVPIHQTASYLLGDTQRAQRLFALE